MANEKPEGSKAGEDMVQVPQALLQKMQEDIAKIELAAAEKDNKIQGLEEILADLSPDAPVGEKKLKEKKNFEPAFRTARLRKYPIAGNVEKMDYVIGWSTRGAYQEVDRSGVSPQIVDMIDLIFLSQPKKAEKVRLLDFLNNGIQVNCKIIDTEKKPRVEATGEEIDVTVWDPAHGLVATGDKVDGYVGYHDITYTLKVPGINEPLKINGEFLN